jgi:hypothetical protein
MSERLISWSRQLQDSFAAPDQALVLLNGSSPRYWAVFTFRIRFCSRISPVKLRFRSSSLTLSSARDALGFLLVTLLDHGIFPAFTVMFSFFLVAVTGIFALLTILAREKFEVEMPFAVLTTAITILPRVHLGILAQALPIPSLVDFSLWHFGQSLFKVRCISCALVPSSPL